MLRSDTALGLVYTRSAMNLLLNAHVAIMLRCDTGFGLMYTSPARILL